MAKKIENSDQSIRRRAEKSEQKKADLSVDGRYAMSPEEEQKVLHELRVHQIELEMQNEEMRRVQIELELARARYFDLYDMAPVGYLTISVAGMVLETNLTLCALLGMTRNSLIKKPISKLIFKSDQDIYYLHRKNLHATGAPQQCELRMIKNDGTVFWAQISATIQQDAEGQPACRAVITDVTQLKAVEHALRQSETKYRSLIESACDVIFCVDEKGVYQFTNTVFASAFDQTPDYFIGKTFWDVYDQEQADYRYAAVQKVFKTGKGESLEVKVPLPKGDKYFQATVSPIKDQFDRVVLALTHSIDITDKKLAEVKLSHSHDLMRYIIEHNKSAIAVLDRDLKYLYCSRSYLVDYRIKDQNIIGKHHYMVFPDIPQKWKDIHQKALQGEVSNMEEDVFLRQDGTTDWNRWECRPWYDANGEIGGIIVYTEVITARKKLEISLANENNLLRTTLISVGDGVISTDSQGRIMIINRVGEALSGWTQEAAKGKPIQDVFATVDEHSREKCDDIVRLALRSGKTIEVLTNTILIAKDGTEREIEQNAAPIIKENGELVGVVLVFRDASEKKKKLAEIEYLSYHDHLTGLYNRRHFDESMKKYDSLQTGKLTLIMADVNGLKLTNDAFGHKAGDTVLEKVANILKRECREEDIISRVGGDEFAIILPEADCEHADKLISRINAAIAEEKIDNITLSVSIGYAVKQRETDQINDIYKQAEDEMYRRKLSESSSMRSKTIDLIMNTLFAKSNREMEHAKRVSKICEAIATQLKFTENEIAQITITGLMHDIGKIGIDEAVLNDQGRLSDEQWKQIEKHPEIGFRILSSVNEFSLIATDVLCHHERNDGTGYPRGLKGKSIPFQARILAVADSFDAMTNFRPYREPISEDEAILELKRCAGTQFDPEIARVFVEKVLGKKWE